MCKFCEGDIEEEGHRGRRIYGLYEKLVMEVSFIISSIADYYFQDQALTYICICLYYLFQPISDLKYTRKNRCYHSWVSLHRY
jgi:hypothetical protein